MSIVEQVNRIGAVPGSDLTESHVVGTSRKVEVEPNGAVFDLVTLVKVKSEEARAAEEVIPDQLTESLRPYAAEAKVLLQTVTALGDKYNSSLSAAFTVDRLTLRKFSVPEATVNALVRTAEGAHALIASTERELSEVPRRVGQVRLSDNPPALASGIRATVHRAREVEEAVQGAMTRISLYAEEITARLQRAGAPVKLLRVVRTDQPNPAAPPRVVTVGPEEEA